MKLTQQAQYFGQPINQRLMHNALKNVLLEDLNFQFQLQITKSVKATH
jgi:hypothetical protein